MSLVKSSVGAWASVMAGILCMCAPCSISLIDFNYPICNCVVYFMPSWKQVWGATVVDQSHLKYVFACILLLYMSYSGSQRVWTHFQHISDVYMHQTHKINDKSHCSSQSVELCYLDLLKQQFFFYPKTLPGNDYRTSKNTFRVILSMTIFALN